MTGSGDKTLKEASSDLYRIAHNKEAVVADVMRWNAGNHHWDITFLEPFRIGRWIC